MKKTLINGTKKNLIGSFKMKIKNWDTLTKEDEEVIIAVNKLKEKMPKETKIVTDYMTKLVNLIEGGIND